MGFKQALKGISLYENNFLGVKLGAVDLGAVVVGV